MHHSDPANTFPNAPSKVKAETTTNVVDYHAEDWIFAQDPKCYTIQVQSTTSLKHAEAFVAQQNGKDNFAIFAKPTKSRMLYVVICGIYKDKASANAAAAMLPSAAVSPLIQSVGDVQNQIMVTD